MRINVKLVGFLTSTGLPSGFKGGEVDVPYGASASVLLEAIGMAPPVQYLIVRGKQLIELEEILEDGDIIELIPPIGGG